MHLSARCPVSPANASAQNKNHSRQAHQAIEATNEQQTRRARNSQKKIIQFGNVCVVLLSVFLVDEYRIVNRYKKRRDDSALASLLAAGMNRMCILLLKTRTRRRRRRLYVCRLLMMQPHTRGINSTCLFTLRCGGTWNARACCALQLLFWAADVCFCACATGAWLCDNLCKCMRSSCKRFRKTNAPVLTAGCRQSVIRGSLYYTREAERLQAAHCTSVSCLVQC